MSDGIQREEMEVDLLIVGGGSAGLSAAIRFQQMVEEHNQKNPEEYKEKTIEGEVLDYLQLHKQCCRRHMLTHVDII